MDNINLRCREFFHFTFLEHLLRTTNPQFYVLKGGVNLRFFFKSPRYSEDMDLDVSNVSVETLKKNGYKILDSPAFRRTLATIGITDLLINDPAKAKQTTTTQRFRVRLVISSGEQLPTKIEFSRRSSNEDYLDEIVDPEIARIYKRLSFHCQHYGGSLAVQQKIKALAGRPETQARDVFDLNILYLGGYFIPFKNLISKEILEKAIENAVSITYEQYRDQVEEYLSSDSSTIFAGRRNWNKMQETIIKELES